MSKEQSMMDRATKKFLLWFAAAVVLCLVAYMIPSKGMQDFVAGCGLVCFFMGIVSSMRENRKLQGTQEQDKKIVEVEDNEGKIHSEFTTPLFHKESQNGWQELSFDVGKHYGWKEMLNCLDEVIAQDASEGCHIYKSKALGDEAEDLTADYLNARQPLAVCSFMQEEGGNVTVSFLSKKLAGRIQLSLFNHTSVLVMWVTDGVLKQKGLNYLTNYSGWVSMLL